MVVVVVVNDDNVVDNLQNRLEQYCDNCDIISDGPFFDASSIGLTGSDCRLSPPSSAIESLSVIVSLEEYQ